MIKFLRIPLITLVFGLIVLCFHPLSANSKSIVVLPNDGYKVYFSLIRSAESTIYTGTYKLIPGLAPDKDLLDAFTHVIGKEVTVKLMVEGNLTKSEIPNIAEGAQTTKDALTTYKELGVKLSEGFQQSFPQIHTKFLIVDDEVAVIGTTNFDKQVKGEIPIRDFAYITTDKSIIKEVKEVFEADSQNTAISPQHKELVWGPDNSRTNFTNMIRQAKKTIHIYQQDITDGQIVEELLNALGRGVKLYLLMSTYPFYAKVNKNESQQNALRNAGAYVGLTDAIKIHAKVLIIDAENPESCEMYLGSCNFYQPAIDKTRTLGIRSKNYAETQRVLEIFRNDWKTAKVL